MTAPRWPAPGATFGPDRLGELRDLFRAHPERGVWCYHTSDGPWSAGSVGYDADHVEEDETWLYVGPHPADPPDTQPAEPEPARTVEVSLGWTFWRKGESAHLWRSRADAEFFRVGEVRGGFACGPVVEVRASLPLPVEPAVVTGTVVPVEVSDG